MEKIENVLMQHIVAQNKVELSADGKRHTNPHQQGAANRLYRKASKLAKDINMSDNEFISLHRTLLIEFNNK